MNQNNKKIPFVPIAIIIAAVLLVGYFLYRTSPDSPNKASSANATDSMHGGNTASNSESLNALVGKPLPNMQLTDKDGKAYTLDNLKGKNTVLFFSEGLMCYPACWNQIASFGTDQRFTTDQIQAISVVVDSASEWQKALNKMPDLAKSATLFDIGGSYSRQLGLLTLPSSMHKGSLPGHTYIVLDKNGVVRYVNDDPNMAIANDVLIKKIAELK